MAKAHLTHDQFFTQLSALLTATHSSGHGSIHLSQKRLTFDTTSSSGPTTDKIPDDPLWDLHPPEPLPILVRATDGKSTKGEKRIKNPDKVKLSTVVKPDEIEAFFARYAEVCKAGMAGLKKRDRSKRKKGKGKKGAVGGEGGTKA
ncbi:hypothetical protein LTR09_001434 [Extremus antarcticus]|uniref:Signal recognition particle subunit SRP14 n=1 Tax=Extremus antarcticus TaxID=702011 RepID=A0AAJ0LX40_9PEZI|nr:hypothetical protein LTR09_001434 [Extremus antarcticus]